MYYQLILTEVKDRDETINALIGAAKLSANEAIYAVDNTPSFITNSYTLKEAEELKTNIERSNAVIDIVEKEETYKVIIKDYNHANKINIIKNIRSILDLDLYKAKNTIDYCPTIVATGLLKQEADQLVNELNAVEAFSILERE